MLAFLQGEAAVARQDPAPIARSVEVLAHLESTMEKEKVETWRVRELELLARLAELRGRSADAVTALRQAIAIDERTPAVGPAGDAPPRERLGELLSRLGQPVAAAEEFQRVLQIHPRRARALLGAARAATAAGAASANQDWSRLASLWVDADADTPGLHEARRHAAVTATSAP